MAAHELEVVFELLLRASVGKRSSRQVRQALPDRQIQALDERRVQCRRVFRVSERLVEAPRGYVNGTSFDLDDTIVSARLQDLSIERRLPKDAADHLLVEIESVGDDQWKTLKGHPVGNVAHEGERVPVASSADYGRRPETRPDFDRGEDPRYPVLAPGEGANLVGLELLDSESGDSSAVETAAR